MATPPPASPGSCAARPDRFRLTGPSSRPDPRINAYRGDIADVALAGTLFAPHYAAGLACTVTAASTMLRTAPDRTSTAVSQLVRGEIFVMLDTAGAWAWGRCGHDDYVGYVAHAGLGGMADASHRIVAVAAPLFDGPSIKAAARAIWPIGALFAGERDGDFLRTEAGFVHHRHARAIGDVVPDPVTVAEGLLGQPYLWGGRGGGGIDCSGLVQLSLGFAGTAAPRDSDMQRDALGTAIAGGDALRRSDLIFFPGHVGLMTNETHMIHATAHTMTVTTEPLADVVARLAPSHPQPILARKRL